MGRGSKESRSLQSQARAGGGFAAVDSRKLHMLRGRVIMLRRQRSRLAPEPRGGTERAMVNSMVAMYRPKWGGIWYFDIPSPNTTVFSVLWPPSIALWGSLLGAPV
jgi:hypothetical protein